MIRNFEVDKIFFIDCPDTKEPVNNNALTLYTETVSQFNKIRPNVEIDHFLIDSKEEFLNVFQLINEKDLKEKNIIIHVYLHGSKDKNGLVANDKKLITWKEIQNEIRKINIQSSNGLFLIMALCHGSYLAEKLNLFLKSPFNSLIASKYEEYVVDIYSLFHKFYSNLLFNSNLVTAFTDAEKDSDNFKFKNTENIAVKAFKSIVEKRVEYLPNLYYEYLEKSKHKISFEEFDIMQKSKYPEMIKLMEENFFIQ